MTNRLLSIDYDDNRLQISIKYILRMCDRPGYLHTLFDIDDNSSDYL